MATLNVSELAVLDDFLDTLGIAWEPVAKQGLYEGAREMKEALVREIERLPVTKSDRYYFKAELPLTALRPIEKEGLLEGVGISKMKRDKDGISVSIGFDGYNKNGTPNALVARSLAKGTSVQKPNRFVTRTFKAAENRRVKAIVDKINSIKIQDK